MIIDQLLRRTRHSSGPELQHGGLKGGRIEIPIPRSEDVSVYQTLILVDIRSPSNLFKPAWSPGNRDNPLQADLTLPSQIYLTGFSVIISSYSHYQ
jgi:hypothetical protein